MNRKMSWGLLSAVLLAGAAQAQQPPTVAQGYRDPTAGDQLRPRLGMLGGIEMQPSQAELGLGFLKVLPSLPRSIKLDLDLSLGVRSYILHVVPAVGIRGVLFEAPRAGLAVSGFALAGLNLGFYRGSMGIGLPLRLGAALDVCPKPGFTVGLESSVDLGPLVVPYGAMQAGFRMGVVAGFKI